MSMILHTEAPEETWRHPELQPGEVFRNYFLLDQYEKIKQQFKSARLGEKTYDINGIEIPGTNYRPVFLSKDDYRKYLEEKVI